MANIDNMLKSILGKSKTKRYGLKANINSILGKSTQSSKTGASPFMQQRWKSLSPTSKRVLRKRLPDIDGDRTPDIFDCSPRNIMRQDDKSKQEYGIILEIHRNGDVKFKTKQKEIVLKEFETNIPDIYNINNIKVYDYEDDIVAYGDDKNKLKDAIAEVFVGTMKATDGKNGFNDAIEALNQIGYKWKKSYKNTTEYITK